MPNHVLMMQVGESANTVRVFTDRDRALEYVGEHFVELLLLLSWAAGEYGDKSEAMRNYKLIHRHLPEIVLSVRTPMGAPIKDAEEIWIDVDVPGREKSLQPAMFTITTVPRDTSKAKKPFDETMKIIHPTPDAVQ